MMDTRIDCLLTNCDECMTLHVRDKICLRFFIYYLQSQSSQFYNILVQNVRGNSDIDNETVNCQSLISVYCEIIIFFSWKRPMNE